MEKTIKTNKDLKISESKTKSKDNDKGSRSKITQNEGTSLQQDKPAKPFYTNNKGLVAETYDWDEDEVTSDNEEMVEVKELMAFS
ncbi:hypothetical protein Tco_0103806 [Tanacetum coccineum]